MEKLTLNKLEQHLGKAAWILKGPVDAADFKIYIYPLLFFKRISDVYDEEYYIALKEFGGDKEYAELAIVGMGLPDLLKLFVPMFLSYRKTY